MADDWQAGDLALCIKVGRWRSFRSKRFVSSRVKGGCVYTVRAFGPCPQTAYPTLWLEGFPGARGSDGFSALRFRKIRPHVPDAEDAETIALLNGQPVPVEA